jgi:hypothetical protein
MTTRADAIQGEKRLFLVEIISRKIEPGARDHASETFVVSAHDEESARCIIFKDGYPDWLLAIRSYVSGEEYFSLERPRLTPGEVSRALKDEGWIIHSEQRSMPKKEPFKLTQK